jgi:hypothetical protein
MLFAFAVASNTLPVEVFIKKSPTSPIFEAGSEVLDSHLLPDPVPVPEPTFTSVNCPSILVSLKTPLVTIALEYERSAVALLRA